MQMLTAEQYLNKAIAENAKFTLIRETRSFFFIACKRESEARETVVKIHKASPFAKIAG